MSRIFDAIKRAQQGRDAKSQPEAPGPDAVELPDRRRSRRWSFDVPVQVQGLANRKEPVNEEAHTLHVNENGALLLLSVRVRKGQKLVLTNTLTKKEQDCHVVFVGTRHNHAIETGVAFPMTNPEFWHAPGQSQHERTSPADASSPDA